MPGVLVFRPNAALLYFNVDTVREHLVALLHRKEAPLRRIILDLSFTTELDLSTIRMLSDFARLAQEDGIAVLLADAHYRVARCSTSEARPAAGRPRARVPIAELVDGLQYDLPPPALAKVQAQR